MCVVCIKNSLETWQRYEDGLADQQADMRSRASHTEWQQMDAVSNGQSQNGRPHSQDTDQSELEQPLQAGTAAGGTANGTSVGFNQTMVDFLAEGNDGIPEYWETSGGQTATTLTYGFTTSSSFASGFGEQSGWNAFSAAQQTAATIAIGLWDDLIPVSFSVAADPNAADIKFSNTTTSIGYAHAWSPGIVGSESNMWARIAGSVWLNPAYDASQQSNDLVTAQIGDHGFATYVHEIGHALGLQHAGNYNGGSPAYGDSSSGWLFAEDSEQYTIMSYFDESNTGADFGDDLTWSPYIWGVSAQTPMVYDILAIQQLYGADYTTRSGDTTYGFNSNVGGQIYDFTINPDPALTIWDGDGTDTIDLSGYSANANLSLVAGAYSSVNGATNNLAIAYDVDIENAVGGSGNDTLTGNDLANELSGGAGTDTLTGNQGHDTLDGGASADVLDGGDGFDIASYASAASGVTIDLSNTANNTGDAAGDTYVSIEVFRGSNFGDSLTGTAGTQWLLGGGGNDQLFGGDGHDALAGGLGADVLDGGNGFDNANYSDAQTGMTIDASNTSNNTGEAAGDTYVSIEMFSGSQFNDIITGDNATNYLFGNDGDDILNGNGGHDALYGGAGADTLIGGAGTDNANYSSSESGLTADLSNSAVNTGDAAGDTYDSIEMLSGSHYVDQLFGNESWNYLFANGGDDTIHGRGGDDLISGGAGNDTMTGGSGADQFTWAANDTGVDTILDFENDVDQLKLSAWNFADISAVISAASQVGTDVFIDFGNGSGVTLADFSLAQFDSVDFII